jgi:phosphate transport system substrate-binding protein
MNKVWRAVVLSFLAVSCDQRPSDTPTRGEMVAAVSESHAALIEQEAREFQRLYPEARISVLPRATREAVVALLNDSLKLIFIDRPLNDEEQAVVQGAKMTPTKTKIADDAIAIIVHHTNPITQMRLQSLQELLLARIHSWRDITEGRWTGPIRVALTGRNSGVYEFLANAFFPTNVPLRATYWAETDTEVVRYVARNPGAIGAVPFSILRDSSPFIKPLALERGDSSAPTPFVKPHQANVYRGWYPLRYSLYCYSTARSNSVAAGFIAFVASAPGQKILLNAGLVPASMPVRLVQITQE